MLFVLMITAAVALFLYKKHSSSKQHQEIQKLKDRLTQLSDNFPCSAQCTVCRLTGKTCPGKKSCPIRKVL